MKKLNFLGITMVLALMLISVIASAQPPEALVHYKFDEDAGTTAIDATDNVNNGIIKGTVNWVEGEIDGAIQLAGDGGITLPAEDMGMTSDEGSVAFWLIATKPTSIFTIFWAGKPGTPDDPASASMGGGFGPEFEMHVHLEQSGDFWTGGEASFWAMGEDRNYHIFSDPEKGGSAGVAPVNPILLSDSVWHHFAVSWGDQMKLYIDGEVIWDTTDYYSKGFNLDSIFLGRMGNNSRRFIGSLDDVRIFGGVLTDQEVKDLYNKVQPPEALDQQVANPVNLSVFPNPASQQARVSYFLEQGQTVSMNVYNVAGSLLENVFTGVSSAGKNVQHIDIANYSSGVYFIELNIGKEVIHTKLIVE